MAKRKKPARAPAEATEPVSHEAPTNPDEHKDLLVAKERDRSSDNIFKRFGHWYRTHKKLSIPLTVLLVIALILAVPYTRYKVLGLAIHKTYAVTVVDSTSGKPVSQADVKLAGKTAKTDEKGQATITKAPLGDQKLAVSKKHYKDSTQTVLVSLTNAKNKQEVKLEATGRQVPVSVTNKITGKPVQGATIIAGDTESKTDEKGEAVLVVPADKTTVQAVVKQEGFNDTTTEIEVSEQLTDKNKLTLTPAGKIYFLSKQSGKIDVVKTNLDGSERQTVLAGTGKEEADTELTASRDWKYLALKAKREESTKLYLIETATDKLTTIDEGDATFSVGGWGDHYLLYTVNRNNHKPWQPKAQAVKSYDAASKRIIVIHESEAGGDPTFSYTETLSAPVVIRNEVVYAKSVEATDSVIMKGKEAVLYSAKYDGTNKQARKSFAHPTQYLYYNTLYVSIQLAPHKPAEVYFSASANTYGGAPFDTAVYAYGNGVVTKTQAEHAYVDYKVYRVSPSGGMTFWAEGRDGKNTLLIGDKDAENGQEIAKLSEFDTYGWFTEDYLLVSKRGSELYIMGKDKNSTALKISDYHTSHGGEY